RGDVVAGQRHDFRINGHECRPGHDAVPPVQPEQVAALEYEWADRVEAAHDAIDLVANFDFLAAAEHLDLNPPTPDLQPRRPLSECKSRQNVFEENPRYREPAYIAND